MANKIKLEVYTIRIRYLRKKTEFLKLNDFFDGDDFITFFYNYILSFDKQLEINVKQKKSIKIDKSNIKLSSHKRRIISGVIESGDYGYESTIYSTKDGKKKYKRQIEDTEILPFYFLVYLPKNDNKCFLVLQRFGVYGINSVIQNHLGNYFINKYPEYRMEIDAFISQKLAQKFINKGNIRKYVLTRYNLSSDITENLGIDGHQEDILSIELTIKAKKNSGLNFLRNKVKTFIRNSNARVFTLKDLDRLGFDGNHKSKMTVQLGRNTRSIDLSDTGQIRPYFDIDEDIEKDKSGHPIFKSINSTAIELINDLEQELGK